jgi:hypothetical protein
LTSTAARRIATAFVILAAAACAKTDSAKKDSTAAATDATQQRALVAQAGAPGALPKPLDQMTGDELYTFTQSLTFGGGEQRERRCRGRAGCRGNRPADSTMMRVDAVEREDSLSVNSLPANGAIGARALNLGAYADSMYSTRPGKQYQYFLLVLPQSAGLATWKLVELDTTQGARAHRTVSSGRFTGCGHAFRKGARAAFKTCNQAAAEMRNASFRGFMQAGDGESPIWIGCSVGCCTADGPDGRG